MAIVSKLVWSEKVLGELPCLPRMQNEVVKMALGQMTIIWERQKKEIVTVCNNCYSRIGARV